MTEPKDVFEWAIEYLNRSFVLEIYEKSIGKKGPRSTRKRIEGLFALEGYPFSDATCIGFFTDKKHIFVDLDAPEAIALGPQFLPRTGMISGRPGREMTHWIYNLSAEATDSLGAQYDDPSPLANEKARLIDLIHRGNKKTGSMIICPPSPYDDAPYRQRAKWDVFDEPAVVNGVELRAVCERLAAAALLVRCWTDGQRNSLTIALSGALLREQWKPDEIADFIGRVARAAGDDEWENRLVQPAATAERAKAGTTFGWPTVAEIVGTARAKKLQEWLSKKGEQAKKSKAKDDSETIGPLDIAQNVFTDYESHFKYVPDMKEWASYRQGLWYVDHSAELDVQRAATNTRNKMAAAKGGEPVSQKSISDAVFFLRMMPALHVTVDAFDMDSNLLNGPDGTWDLDKGFLASHDPKNTLTRQIPTPYVEGACCPSWEQQMALTWPDEEIRLYVQRAFGYSLQGTQAERCFFLLFGPGRNGKSLALRVIEMVLGVVGRGYAQQVNTATFARATGNEINSGLAKLRGIRLATVGEFPNRNMNSELIKAITGGESNTARQLYQRTAEFAFQAKLWFTSNFTPGPTDATDLAFWDRMQQIPCHAKFPNPGESGYIPESVLMEQFKAEASGILNWLLEGHRMWRENGLMVPASLKEARTEYKADLDLLEQFLNEDGIIVHQLAKISPDDVGWTNLTVLWEVFDAWCGRIGDDRRHRNQCRSRMELRRAIEQKGFKVSGHEDSKHHGQLKVYGIDVEGMSVLG